MLRVTKMTSPSRLFFTSETVFQKMTAETVFSKENKESCVTRLQKMKPIDIRTGKSSAASKNAAVLIPLCVFEGRPSLLYTVRSRSLKANRGQVAFPGGMEDESDSELKETALRETWEEIGFPPSKIDVWARGPSLGRETLLITPILGFLGDVGMNEFKLNKSEVSHIFCMSLDHLCDPRNFRTTQFRTKESVSYKLPAYLGGPEKIWGVSAVLTHIVLTALVPEFYKNRVRYQPTVFRRLSPDRRNGFDRIPKEGCSIPADTQNGKFKM